MTLLLWATWLQWSRWRLVATGQNILMTETRRGWWTPPSWAALCPSHTRTGSLSQSASCRQSVLSQKWPQTTYALLLTGISNIDLDYKNENFFNSRSNNEAKEGIAVCSKSLSHLEDNSLRFIECIELLRLLGVSKIILSVLSVHPNVLKVEVKN